MNFIVSGQPKLGHESWPPPVDDKVLSDRLYGQRGAKEDTRMEVKFEKVGDRLITYYHFSKLKGVTSCLTEEESKMNPRPIHGRPGSFFVMSLRIDGYYSTDFSKIYTLLEEMYEKYVKGKVLKMSKEGYLVYQIMKLEDAKETWKSITSELKAKGKDTFLKCTKPITEDIMIKGFKTSDYFCVNDDEKDIESALIQNGGVVILSSEEMNARKERFKQHETISDNNYLIEEEAQSHMSLTEEDRSKRIILSGEQQNNYDKNDDVTEYLQTPLKKEESVKKIWLPIALIMLGLIELWLCISNINMRGTVNSLIEQIDSLTVQSSSSKLKIENVQIKKDVDAKKVQDYAEDVHDVAVGDYDDSEDAEIIHLDLEKKDGDTTESVSSMRRGYTYIITAQIQVNGNRQNAKGTGQYSCDVGPDKGVYINQNGNKCTITIADETNGPQQITLKYIYKYKGADKIYPRTIRISK